MCELCDIGIFQTKEDSRSFSNVLHILNIWKDNSKIILWREYLIQDICGGFKGIVGGESGSVIMSGLSSFMYK